MLKNINSCKKARTPESVELEILIKTKLYSFLDYTREILVGNSIGYHSVVLPVWKLICMGLVFIFFHCKNYTKSTGLKAMSMIMHL